MLKPEEAKSLFRGSLGLLLTIVFWPFISGIISGILAIVGFKSLELVALALAIIWLALFVWFIVKLWKIAPEVGVTPWAFLWIFLPFTGLMIVGMLFLEPLKYMADNKPANERLPLTWGLIKESWKTFIANIKPALPTSVYFLYASLILGISAVLTNLWAPWGILHFFVTIGFMVVFAWISVRLFFVMLRLEDGKALKGDEKDLATKNLGSYIWVTFLTLLISAGPLVLIIIIAILFAISLFMPLIGGTGAEIATVIQSLQDNLGALIGGGTFLVIAFIASWVWMVYKSIQYSQVIPALLMDGELGYFALKESARIVKNRWWGMLWKNQLWGMVVGSIAFMLFMGLGIVLAIPVYMLRTTQYVGVVDNLLSTALQGGINMFLYPLSFIFIIKLYKAFRKTAK